MSYFGYKNHIKIDTKSKLIVKYEVTDASVHDSQVLENLLDSKDAYEDFYGDSAYSGKLIGTLYSSQDSKRNNEAIIKSKLDLNEKSKFKK